MMRLQAQLRRISSGTSLDDALQYFESDLIRCESSLLVKIQLTVSQSIERK